jgi:hypothetical protein
MEWYDLLTPALREAAYKAANGEMAWPREHALSVISILERNGYEILGIDTWLPTIPRPTPLIRDWDPDRENVAISPTSFVETFDLHPSEIASRGQEPCFNIWAKRARDTHAT